MKRFDALIIGGGIIGCTIGGELCKRGNKVAVLDQGIPCQEASKAAAGVLAPHAGPHLKTPFFSFLRQSLVLYPEFIQEIESVTGFDTEFRRSGLLYLAMDEEEGVWLQERYEWQVQSGVKVQWLSGEEVQRREPHVGKSVRKGVYFSEDCQVNNVKLAEAVHEWARNLGVIFFPQTRVTRIWTEDNAVRGAITPIGNFESTVVVNAAGCWADFDVALPFRIPVKPSRGQILVFHHDSTLFHHVIHLPGIYSAPQLNGSILVGSTVESVGYNKAVTAKGMFKLVKGLLHINPELSFLSFSECWSGLRPRTRDGIPILGFTPIKGLILATGHFRNGILGAPLTGRVISQIILGENPSFDITPFEITRFFKRYRTGSGCEKQAHPNPCGRI